jgi:prophage antirepressor-like protein
MDANGEPLFVGKDVCDALGYTNHNNALERAGLQVKVAGTWRATEEGKAHSSEHAWAGGTKSGYNLKWNIEKVRKIVQN